MRPRKRAQIAFASALILFAVSGFAASVTIAHLSHSQKWMFHTDEVDTAISKADATMETVSRAWMGYVATGDAGSLEKYRTFARRIPAVLQRVRELTADNPVQQSLCGSLEDVTNRRMSMLAASVEQMQKGPIDDHAQLEISQNSATLAMESASVVEAMRQEEEKLFQERRRTSQSLFLLLLAIMGGTSALAVILFCVHYLLIARQLIERERAEKKALDSQEASRRLSTRLMGLQDEERRKFSRELHDSLGQYLAMIKMDLSRLSENQIAGGLLADSIKYLDQSIAETRTLSHLLHPPLLDEIGFASAATWFAEGFGERSGIQVHIDVPDDLIRLPASIELVLFRVLQESLTNIHRHSSSPRAECSVKVVDGKDTHHQIILRIRDFGRGMSRAVLEGFRGTGKDLGVGLAGMRERVRELDGKLEIHSDGNGTTVVVTLPFTRPMAAAETAAVGQEPGA